MVVFKETSMPETDMQKIARLASISLVKGNQGLEVHIKYGNYKRHIQLEPIMQMLADKIREYHDLLHADTQVSGEIHHDKRELARLKRALLNPNLNMDLRQRIQNKIQMLEQELTNQHADMLMDSPPVDSTYQPVYTNREYHHRLFGNRLGGRSVFQRQGPFQRHTPMHVRGEGREIRHENRELVNLRARLATLTPGTPEHHRVRLRIRELEQLEAQQTQQTAYNPQYPQNQYPQNQYNPDRRLRREERHENREIANLRARIANLPFGEERRRLEHRMHELERLESQQSGQQPNYPQPNYSQPGFNPQYNQAQRVERERLDRRLERGGARLERHDMRVHGEMNVSGHGFVHMRGPAGHSMGFRHAIHHEWRHPDIHDEIREQMFLDAPQNLPPLQPGQNPLCVQGWFDHIKHAASRLGVTKAIKSIARETAHPPKWLQVAMPLLSPTVQRYAAEHVLGKQGDALFNSYQKVMTDLGNGHLGARELINTVPQIAQAAAAAGIDIPPVATDAINNLQTANQIANVVQEAMNGDPTATSQLTALATEAAGGNQAAAQAIVQAKHISNTLKDKAAGVPTPTQVLQGAAATIGYPSQMTDDSDGSDGSDDTDDSGTAVQGWLYNRPYRTTAQVIEDGMTGHFPTIGMAIREGWHDGLEFAGTFQRKNYSPFGK
jgi:hypothetical protein